MQSSVSWEKSVGKSKIFFMHIPKVAGTSVNSVFRECFGDKDSVLHCENGKYDLNSYSFISGHVAWPMIKEMLDLKSIYKFTIMRDPVDHLMSHLRWVWRLSLPEFEQQYLQHDEEIQSVVNDLSQIDLGNVSDVESYLHSASGHARKLFINGQSRYFLPPDLHGINISQGSVRKAISSFFEFDHIGIVENLQEDLEKVANDLGINLNKVSEENKNPTKLNIDFSSLERDRLSQFVPIDLALYELARRRSDRSIF